MEHIKKPIQNDDKWIGNMFNTNKKLWYDASNVIVKPKRINLHFQHECQNRALDNLNLS